MIKSLNKKFSFEKIGITQSLMADYMACPRKFAIRTHELAQPAKMVMELGSYGHKMIETGEKEKFVFDKMVTTEQREQIIAAMKAIIPEYFKYYKAEDSKYLKSSEQVIDTTLTGIRIRGKIDCILTHKDEIKLRETKFKSRISEDELDATLGLDWQSLFYLMALTQQGKEVYTVEYDVIRYPTIKTGMKPEDIFKSCQDGIKKEPEHWFKRWTTKFDQSEVFSFTGELVQKLNEMRNRTIWYRNECSCKGNFKCPFVNYCMTGETTGLIKKKLHSELDN